MGGIRRCWRRGSRCVHARAFSANITEIAFRCTYSTRASFSFVGYITRVQQLACRLSRSAIGPLLVCFACTRVPGRNFECSIFTYVRTKVLRNVYHLCIRKHHAAGQTFVRTRLDQPSTAVAARLLSHRRSENWRYRDVRHARARAFFTTSAKVPEQAL